MKLVDAPAATTTLKVDTSLLNKVQRLQLCMYLIEQEFHFTGDGLWLEPPQHSDSTYATSPPLLDMSTTTAMYNKHYIFGRNAKVKVQKSI